MYFQEKYHWKEALCTGFSLFLGIGAIGSGLQDASRGMANQAIPYWIVGVLLIIAAIAAFKVTNGWKHANDLSIGKKIVAYLPVLVTGLIFILLLMAIEIAKMVIQDSTSKK